MKKTPGKYIVRTAGFDDAEAIFALIREYPNELVPRAVSDIEQNVDRFLVAESRGQIVGTVSWSILPEIGLAKDPSVELKSLAISRKYRRRGIGRALVLAAAAWIRRLDPSRIIVLTFTPEFFRKFGFREVPKKSLMHKLYLGCSNCTKYDSPLTCPEVAMSVDDLSVFDSIEAENKPETV